MKKLVTGSTGFIESAIARELIKNGEEVTVLIRKTRDTRNIDKLEVERVMPGYIDGGINIIDVEDVAHGHILAAKKGKVGDRYLLGNSFVEF